MRLRSTLWLGLIIVAVFTVVVTTSLGARSARDTRQEGGAQILIQAEQLPDEAGVTLRCGTGRLSAPNTLEHYTCAVVNNTRARVRSFSAAFTIVAERGGEELRTSWVTAYDMLIHPDFNDPSNDKSIAPGGEYTLSPAGPTTIEDVVIKGLEIKLTHVELHDGTTLGARGDGLNIVTRRREGAAKFRQWLKQNYWVRGKSLPTVISLIEQSPRPASGAEPGEAGLEQGAEMYRMLLLKRYKTHGAAWLKKVMDN